MKQSAKNIAVKLYMSAEAFLETQSKCAAAGVSMSAAGNLALREWQPAHRMRRPSSPQMPTVGLKRPLSFPGRGANDMRRLH